ncbi:MAG: GAF domain-containing protein [Phormidesmis sp.]
MADLIQSNEQRQFQAETQEVNSTHALLMGIAEAAQRLLAIEDFEAAVNGALGVIARAVNINRIHIFANHTHPQKCKDFATIPYRWVKPGLVNIDLTGRFLMVCADVEECEQWLAQLQAGRPVQVRSILALPLFVEGEYWGALSLDNGETERLWDATEIAALETAAATFAAALQRQKNAQVLIERQHLLTATAVADDLLSEETLDSGIDQALAVIGQEIEADQGVTVRTLLASYIKQLRERDSLLNCVNLATQRLVAADDLAAALPDVLEVLGMGTRQCRSYILKNIWNETIQGKEFHLMLEWDAPNIPTKQAAGGQFPIPIDRFPDRLVDPLKAGEATQFLARELDGISIKDRVNGQALSLLGVPITIDGEWWGLLGLDDCINERVWSEAEIAVLKTAATAIGSAIERSQVRASRAKAERLALIEQERAARADELEAANKVLRMRDRWLEATAAAVSKLLSADALEISVQAALRILGHNLACDHLCVKRYNPVNAGLGTFQLLYEWVAKDEGEDDSNPQPSLQVYTDEPTYIPASDFGEWIQQLMTGESMGGEVTELAVPFRQRMEALGAQYVYAVPIFVGGSNDLGDNFWGLMLMDYSQGARQLSLAEMSVLETAAACVGGAIQREQIQHERQVAERSALLEKERERAAQERARLLSSVAEAANLLLRSANFEEVLPAVVQRLGETVECDRCGIGREIIHPFTGESAVEVKPEWEWRTPSTLPAAAFSPRHDELFCWNDGPYLTAQMRAGVVASYLVADLPAKDRQFMAVQGTTATLFVPIFVNQTLWGFIHFDSNRSDPKLYGEAEISILQIAAESIAAAIARQTQDEALRTAEKAVLEEQEKAACDRVTELSKINEAVNHMLTALAANPETDAFLGLLLKELSKQTGACKTHLFLYDEATHTIQQHCTVQDDVLYISTAPKDPELFKQSIPADITNTWQTIIKSPLPIANDVERLTAHQDNFWWPGTLAWHINEGHREVACFRMKVGNIPIGFISFAFRDQTNLSPVQLEFIQALTNQATLSVHLTRLAAQTQSVALTEERNRLAREIHDTLAQAFTGISLQLEAARGSLQSSSTQKTASNLTPNLNTAETSLLRARDLARKGLSEARRSVRALRSAALETDTLPSALRKMLSQTARDTGLVTQFDLEGEPIPIADDIQLNLLRIAQEATTNVLRHAQATQLCITLRFMPSALEDNRAEYNRTGLGEQIVLSDRPTQIQLIITDNGIGFDPATLIDNSGFGIVGIRERTARLYGEIELNSTIGSGTEMMVTVPLR